MSKLSQPPAKTSPSLVAISGWLSWIVSATTQLIVIRLLLTTLGSERYAVFAVLYALNTWFLVADFGLGYSLQNTISSRIGRSQNYGSIIRKGISFASILLAAETAALFALHQHFGNFLLRRFDFLTHTEKSALFLLACTLLLLAGIGQVAYKIWFGEHKGYLSNILPALSLLAGLGAVRVALLYSHTLQTIFIAYLAPPALMGIACLAMVWFQSRDDGDQGANEPILLKAANFGGFTLVAALVTQIDVLIIAQFLEPTVIASYAVISKIFATLFLFFGAALQALWPVCTTHLAVRDWSPVKRYVSYTLVGGALFVVVCTAIIALSLKPILAILAPGGMLVIPQIVVVLFGAYYVTRVWTDTIAMVLQSRSDLRALWIITPIQALISLVLQIYLVRRFGMPGAVFGVLASFLITAAWILPRSLWRSMREDERLGYETSQTTSHGR